MITSDAIRSVADMFGPAARETILLDNFDKHRTEIDLIRHDSNADSAILDLGGGLGINLLCLRLQGHRGRLVLVDRLVEYDDLKDNRMGGSSLARENLRRHDIELSELDFWPQYSSGFADDTFDLVTSFCVIEHLPGSPSQQLKELARILRPGGHAIIGVPNATSLMKRVKLLFGVHPYAPFDEWTAPKYFGHFREYTAQECEVLLTTAGLRPGAVIHSAAVPRSRARNHYHRAKHSPLSATSLALALRYGIELAVPRLRHTIFVVATKEER